MFDDVSVVMPTRDCRPLIETFAPVLQEWLPKAGEVIIVDSNSTDGTVEFLRSAFPYPNVHIYNRPPGLYAAWNFGIQTATRPLTYISTAGDVISQSDLATLTSIMSRHDVDVVVSAPTFLDRDHKPTPGHVWPIHSLWANGAAGDVIQLSGPDLVAFALKAAHPPFYDNWLCSSASNLYRSAFLKSHPFPEDAGHGADTLFGIKNARHMKAAFYRHPCGTFVIHDKSSNASHLTINEIFEVYYLRGYREELRWLIDQVAPGSSAYVKDLLLNIEPVREITKGLEMSTRLLLLEEEHRQATAGALKLQAKTAQLKERNADLKAQLTQAKQSSKQKSQALQKIPGWLRRWFGASV